jgi:predicted nucleic acid-binding protein
LLRSALTNVYFDSSALVKLLVLGDTDSDVANDLFRKADRRSTSVVAYAECRAAIAAATRTRRLTAPEARKAVAALNDVWSALDRLSVSEEIVHRAGELAERRALRGFDAIQLASALAQAPEATLACWDDQLIRAARAEGLDLASIRK